MQFWSPRHIKEVESLEREKQQKRLEGWRLKQLPALSACPALRGRPAPQLALSRRPSIPKRPCPQTEGWEAGRGGLAWAWGAKSQSGCATPPPRTTSGPALPPRPQHPPARAACTGDDCSTSQKSTRGPCQEVRAWVPLPTHTGEPLCHCRGRARKQRTPWRVWEAVFPLAPLVQRQSRLPTRATRKSKRRNRA